MTTTPLSALERDVLASITPTTAQERETAACCARLVAAADAELAKHGVPGRATVQGSIAKGTWLAGSADIDLFLLLDPSVPAQRLERIALDVGHAVLQATQTRYAQHPYVTGSFEGRTVDLVPAYAVASPSSKMSAVDRTPFHTEWVRRELDEAARGQARLVKRWMKGVGVYGAQTATGGFSGYLAEVLVARFGGLAGVVTWLAGNAQPRRIALGSDQVSDDVSPLVVVDPIDPARNCAAAVQSTTLQDAAAAAQAYTKQPGKRFFFPNAPRAEAAATLHDALKTQKAAWSGLVLRPRTDRLDIVLPQFQKAARSIASGLDDAGFPVRRLQALALDDGSQVLLQWVADGRQLPATRTHQGPAAATAGNAERFRSKWTDHPDAAGPVRQNAAGLLEVDVKVRDRTAHDWLRSRMPAIPLGRHVQDALPDARLLDDPAAAPPAWAPVVADFVLDRRPWERA